MKYLLLGALLVTLASVACSQTETTETRRPTRPDTSLKGTPPTDTMSNSAVRRAVICSGVSNHEPTEPGAPPRAKRQLGRPGGF